MKQILSLAILLLSIGAYSQNLEQFINKDADAVVEVNGEQIFSLIDYADLEALMPPDPSGTADLSQYGFDAKSKAYYFYQKRDDVSYQNVLVQLSDVKNAEQFILSMTGATPTDLNGYKFIQQQNMTASWNNNHAILSYGDFPTTLYTKEDLLAEKALEAEEATEDTDDEYNVEIDSFEMERQLDMELMIKNLDPPFLHSDEEMSAMLAENLSYILTTDPAQSVRQDASYNGGKTSNSSAYLWVKSFNNLIMNEALISELSSMVPGGPSMEDMDFSMGMKGFTSNLIFDEDEIKIGSKFNLSPDVVDYYKDVYGSKIDRSFLKHFNEDEALSYMSFSTDMTKSMQGYPDMLTKLYGSMIPNYREELDVAMDLLSVVLDEEAIGDLITGDGLFVLHKVENKEVTYMTNEYDEDFNATEVEKTRMSPTPIFSIMMGSENKSIVNKLMKIARKYEFATHKGAHHQIPLTSMGAPFDMYFTHHDGIVFFTNSATKVGHYATGKKSRKLGKHKQRLKNNVFNFYVDTEAALNEVSNLVPASPQTMDYMKENYKEMYMTMGKVTGNNLGMDWVIKTKGGKGNTLKLILDSLNNTMKGI